MLEQRSEMYLNEAITLLEDDDRSPTFTWDIAKEKIDKSKENIDSKAEAYRYLNNFFEKTKNLPRAIKTRLSKYVAISFIGLLGVSVVSNIIPEDMPEVKRDVVVSAPEEEEEPAKEIYSRPIEVSNSLTDFLKYEEGSTKHKGEPVLSAYKIGDGMITVGWGHAEKVADSKFRVGEEITPAQAEQLLNQDILEAKGGVDRILNKWENDRVRVEIDQGMYDAMVSMVFNMGIGNFRKSEFIQLVKNGELEAAKEKILTTNVNYPGHVPRREKESQMFGQQMFDSTIREMVREVLSESFPIADPPMYGDRDYKSRGGKIMMSSPEKYLSLVPNLEMDEETLENIEILKAHIESGEELDPPTLYVDGSKVIGHDGRHRAHATMQLGIKEMPVLIVDDNQEVVTSFPKRP